METDILDCTADEESTLIITATFTDEDDAAADMQTLTWSLTDEDGNTINSRADVAVVAPGSSEDIVLSGDDLAFQDAGDSGARILTLKGTYDSNAGSGLPLNQSVKFNINDLKGIT